MSGVLRIRRELLGLLGLSYLCLRCEHKLTRIPHVHVDRCFCQNVDCWDSQFHHMPSRTKAETFSEVWLVFGGYFYIFSFIFITVKSFSNHSNLFIKCLNSHARNKLMYIIGNQIEYFSKRDIMFVIFCWVELAFPSIVGFTQSKLFHNISFIGDFIPWADNQI